MGLTEYIMGFDQLYLWSNPTKTGPVFATVLILLLAICYYSVISVFAYTGLFVLGSAVGIKIYVYIVNTFMKKNIKDPIQMYTDMDMSISESTVREHSVLASKKINCIVQHLRRFFFIENIVDSIKFGLSMWLLTYIGYWFNAMTLIIIGWVGLFSIPKIYLNNRAAIDPILDNLKEKMDVFKGKIAAISSKSSSSVDSMKKEE